MTRIIAGSARGRRLAVPQHGTRPTSDRVRESMFSTLTSELLASGSDWSDLDVLDLYAGSGALGLEAASRGARSVVLVERARPAVDAIRRNMEALGSDAVRLIAADVQQLVQREPAAPCSLVFVDPPYELAATALTALLGALAAHGWIADAARVVVERASSDAQSPLPDGWTDLSQRRYGDTRLWYGRATAMTGE